MSDDAHARPARGAPEPLYDASIATPSHAERARTLVARIPTGTLTHSRWSRKVIPTARS